MIKRDRLQQIIELKFDTDLHILSHSGIELFIRRPSELSDRFQNYDPKKNFQIWLREGERQFKPNHLRVFIDLYLRSKSRPDLKNELSAAFDGIFYGEDPDVMIKDLRNESFEHFLNPLEIVITLSQLFILEQEYGYHKPSKYDPPSLFYQGWIRQVINNNKEIDNICLSIANGNTPLVRYTKLDDKNHKSYSTNLNKLWYLEIE